MAWLGRGVTFIWFISLCRAPGARWPPGAGRTPGARWSMSTRWLCCGSWYVCVGRRSGSLRLASSRSFAGRLWLICNGCFCRWCCFFGRWCGCANRRQRRCAACWRCYFARCRYCAAFRRARFARRNLRRRRWRIVIVFACGSRRHGRFWISWLDVGCGCFGRKGIRWAWRHRLRLGWRPGWCPWGRRSSCWTARSCACCGWRPTRWRRIRYAYSAR